MIKAVIIGFAHMHVNEVALYISRHPEYSLEAAADMPSDLEKIEPLRYTPEWNKENICQEQICYINYLKKWA